MKGYDFLSIFEDYHRYRTDAPRNFATLTGIQMLGHAMGWNSIHLIQPSAVHHNMYVLLDGKSTLSRKDTTQDLAKEVYPMDRWAPNDYTPERFIGFLSEQPERFQWMGEFSKELKRIKRGGYMTDMIELWNEFHKCPYYYRRELRRERKKDGEEKKKSLFEVTKTYLSLHSTITPEMLKKYVDEELMSGGALARWLIVKGIPNPKPRGRLPSDTFILADRLQFQLEQVVRMGREEPTAFEFTDEALAKYNEIEKEAYKHELALPFAGRYLNYVVSIADILAVSDALGVALERDRLSDLGSLNKLIELIDLGIEVESVRATRFVKSIKSLNQLPKEYVERAWKEVKPCLEYAETLVEYVKMEKPVAILKDYLREHNPATRSKTLQFTGLSAGRLDYAEETLRRQEFLIVISYKKVDRRGTKHSGKVYCLQDNAGTQRCTACEWRKACYGKSP